MQTKSIEQNTGFLGASLDPRLAAALATLCAAAGLFLYYNATTALMSIWRSDDLKSVGMIVPFVCAALILRAWRGLGWETDGTWWGLALLLSFALLLFVRDRMLLVVTINHSWLLQIPPLPLVAVAYATSFVLLFGGTRLLKAAWFPVVLMWAVIPVPQSFSHRIDLPLQHAGASVARGFAHLLGTHLNTESLHIMFTPDYGMFIAPGCNGLRGSIVLALTAIVAGYVYRFRWFIYAPLVAASILLAYLFNFVRLCSLVVFYRLAVAFPRMQGQEHLADQLIGGVLFVVALVLIYLTVEKLRNDPRDIRSAPADEAQAPSTRTLPFALKAFSVAVLAVVFGIDAVHAARSNPSIADHLPAMPQQIGNFKLIQTGVSRSDTGALTYQWGEYAPPNAPDQMTVLFAVAPTMDVHDAEVCHIARGEDPTWHGQIQFPSPAGDVVMTGATYNDGNVQRLQASTVCDGGSCKQFSQANDHITLIYARPHNAIPLASQQTRPVPVLLQVENPDTKSSQTIVEPKMAAMIQDFLKVADLNKLTEPYSKR